VGRAEERCKGAAREIATRWARLLLHCIPLMGHYPRMGAQDFINKNQTQIWFSLRGFSRGVYPKYLVQCVLVSVFMLPLILVK
jgi:hypothetical protein